MQARGNLIKDGGKANNAKISLTLHSGFLNRFSCDFSNASSRTAIYCLGGEVMRILLVEDETKVSSFVARGLTEERFAVDVAADGKSGLNLATTYHYDLVILDLMLPTLDGSQVLRRLRTQNLHVPVLILTARDTVA